MRRVVFLGLLGVVIAGVAAQSVLHLDAVLADGRIGSPVDLDRSNGLPDLVSSGVLAIAALGAVALTRAGRFRLRLVTASLAIVLGGLTLADLQHDGAHPGSLAGWIVIAMVVLGAGQLALVAAGSSRRVRVTLCVAWACLLSSFFVNALDRLHATFDEDRGEPIAEYQVVAKEGLELLGWSLVALALWEEALRRREAPQQVLRSPASPARAPSRRRAA